MRDIRIIINTMETNNLPRLKLEPSSKTVNGREFEKYIMDRKVYSQLVVSFTGEKATVFKAKFNNAFYKLEDAAREPKESKRIFLHLFCHLFHSFPVNSIESTQCNRGYHI